MFRYIDPHNSYDLCISSISLEIGNIIFLYETVVTTQSYMPHIHTPSYYTSSHSILADFSSIGGETLGLLRRLRHNHCRRDAIAAAFRRLLLLHDALSLHCGVCGAVGGRQQRELSS
jgi:hypothetical protein